MQLDAESSDTVGTAGSVGDTETYWARCPVVDWEVVYSLVQESMAFAVGTAGLRNFCHGRLVLGNHPYLQQAQRHDYSCHCVETEMTHASGDWPAVQAQVVPVVYCQVASAIQEAISGQIGHEKT